MKVLLFMCLTTLLIGGCGADEVTSVTTVVKQTDKVKVDPEVSQLSVVPMPDELNAADFSAKVQVRQGNGKKLTCILIHDNETAASVTADKVCKKIVALDNDGKRNVSFVLDGHRYSFDPNRIFTEAGIKKTLKPYNREAADLVDNFAKQILAKLGHGHVVALHNNSDGHYSINDYLPGGSESAAAEAVHMQSDEDSDNFVLVTSPDEFHWAEHLKQNVVMLRSEQPDDGSLSVYCAKHCKSYTNVEAQHGQEKVQIRMVKTLYPDH